MSIDFAPLRIVFHPPRADLLRMEPVAMSVDFAPLRVVFHPPRADLLRMEPVLAIKQVGAGRSLSLLSSRMERVLAIKQMPSLCSRHWMWLQTTVWEQLPETRSWRGALALLEEDHVVTPDYLEDLLL
ncbi:hypothetical protein T484DRAFT_1771526 [Baffinella frigidus]|nr:hypothetical protein T484DRAFT_1771526 [Cryptophyta sp. CCMP2293]